MSPLFVYMDETYVDSTEPLDLEAMAAKHDYFFVDEITGGLSLEIRDPLTANITDQRDMEVLANLLEKMNKCKATAAAAKLSMAKQPDGAIGLLDFAHGARIAVDTEHWKIDAQENAQMAKQSNQLQQSNATKVSS